MSPPNRPEKPRTRTEFEHRLQALIADGRAADIDLIGGYTACDPDPTGCDYTIEITLIVNYSQPATTDIPEE